MVRHRGGGGRTCNDAGSMEVKSGGSTEEGDDGDGGEEVEEYVALIVAVVGVEVLWWSSSDCLQSSSRHGRRDGG